MTNHLDGLAKLVEEDPFFLACPLAYYARSERLDDAGVAHKLGCTMATLNLLKMCRAPALEARPFQEDLARIASHFQVPLDVLEEMTRRGQVIRQMQQSPTAATLTAARDREPESK